MFTYYMRNIIIDDSLENPDFFDFFIFILACFLTVPIDLIISPLELLAGLLYYLHKKRWKDD